MQLADLPIERRVAFLDLGHPLLQLRLRCACEVAFYDQQLVRMLPFDMRHEIVAAHRPGSAALMAGHPAAVGTGETFHFRAEATHWCRGGLVPVVGKPSTFRQLKVARKSFGC